MKESLVVNGRECLVCALDKRINPNLDGRVSGRFSLGFVTPMRVRLATQSFGQAESMLILTIPSSGFSGNAGDPRLRSTDVVLEPSGRTDEMLPQIQASPQPINIGD